jgi:aminoglycoside phosphotransferase (APT) family kinase protein
MSAEPGVRHVLLVVHPDAPQVLAGDGDGAGAPEAGADDNPMDWPDLLAAARDLVPDGAWPFGPNRSAADTRVIVVRARTAAVAPGCRWVDAPDPRWPPGVGAAAGRVLDELRGEAEAGRTAHPRRVAWMRPEWWPRATAWVDGRLGEVGRTRTGELEPLEYWGISVVARVPTADGPVWLKAVPPIFAREPAILAVLSEFAPGRVPGVLAAEEGAEGSRFLMEDAGEVPDDIDEDDRPRLAALLADLQIRTLDAVPRLVAAGCADRSPATLVRELRRLARDGLELDLLDATERTALRRSVPRLVDRLLALEEGPFPAVLVHGDFHPWNVARPAGPRTGPVIIDWTDAAIGPGGADLATLLPWSAGEETRVQVRDAYASVWAEHLGMSPAEVRRAVTAATPAAHVVQALAYDGILRAIEPEAAWSLSGAMAQHLRALITLPDGPP